MNHSFKDHFSRQSGLYARYRPVYPKELYEFIAAHCSAGNRVWDCATGNGQAAVALSGYFKSIFASDASRQQLMQARKNPAVFYFAARAEHCPLRTDSLDLITVAQAIHWFDFDAFYTEARRLLTRKGILAVWTYKLPIIEQTIDSILKTFYEKTVGPFWPPERRYIEEEYSTIPFPFNEIPAPAFRMTSSWNRDDFIGFLRTWSATQAYWKKTGNDPVQLILNDMDSVWTAGEIKTIIWPLLLKIARVH